jgi:hypothetical protein
MSILAWPPIDVAIPECRSLATSSLALSALAGGRIPALSHARPGLSSAEGRTGAQLCGRVSVLAAIAATAPLTYRAADRS